MRSRVVVCSVQGAAGQFELPESRWAPERSQVSGGERSLYELAVAASCVGWDVELRGAINQPILETVCAAAGASPTVGLPPRRPENADIVIVPEVANHDLLAALRLSGAACVMDLLAPPGLWGWSFLRGWSPPDPVRVAIDTLSLPATLRAIDDFGIEMWTPAHGMAEAGARAGVPVKWLGTGTPVPFPDPCPKRMDVAIVELNRWVGLAEKVVSGLDGVSVLRIPRIDSIYSLSEALGPARILVWPSRVEGIARIAREARSVGTVPVALDTNPFVTADDHGGGILLVGDIASMAQEISALLSDRDRLEKLSTEGIETARLQVNWKQYLDRVDSALQAVASSARPAGAALDLVGRTTWLSAKALTDRQASLEREVKASQVYAAELENETERLRAHAEDLGAQLSQRHSELDAARRLIGAYQARGLVRLMDRPLAGAIYREGIKIARRRKHYLDRPER
jgi:hypothetical protein